jgi:hypothetical protein
MAARLEGIFETIVTPVPEADEKPIYSVLRVPEYQSYFIGKDRDGFACMLVTSSDQSGRLQSPIRLENLDAQFSLRCHLRRKNDTELVGAFTVIRCRSLDYEIVRYFLSICETIIAMVGDLPKPRELASAVHRLAAIFQKMQRPPSRPLSGLFGELYFIWRSSNPARAVAAWRVDETARFDFADGNIRIDVKSTGGRIRAHTFSYEQCNPPLGTIAIVVSLFAERSSDGFTLRGLISDIEEKVVAHPDLVFKLHEVISETLGGSLSEALPMVFDTRLADASVRLFSLREIPAIRGDLPMSVSDVHFRSDLSNLTPLRKEILMEQYPALVSLLPP